MTGVLRAITSGRSVFFTGGAGTGKSLLISRIIRALPTQGTHITASTGVAACNIGGVTLHSFAQLANAMKSAVIDKWKAVTTLIIDEISMIDATYFDKVSLPQGHFNIVRVGW